MSGLFITIEGIDGAGKGTQVESMVSYIEEAGIPLILLREPGGTSIGEQIRKILLESKNREMTAETELLLFAAARAQLVREVIQPALAEGKWVLCDRFFDSTIAYQAGGRGLDRDMVWKAIEIATEGLVPDLTFYLDLDPNVAAGRRQNREQEVGEEADRMEREAVDFSCRVRAEYVKLAKEAESESATKASKNRSIITIDAGQDPESIRQEIRKTLAPFVSRGGR